MSLTTLASEQSDVAALLAGPLPHVEVAGRIRVLGFPTSETAVRRYRSKSAWASPSAALHTPPQTGASEAVADNEAEIEDLKTRNALLEADNRRLFGQYTKSKARGDEYVAAVYRAARDAASNVEPYTVVPKFADLDRSEGTEGALIHTTDWQGGKKTETYDFAVMEERVKRFTDKVYKITEIQRKDHPVDDGLLLVTGDMVEGVSIFPGQVWELDGALYEQMFRVAYLLQWQIENLASMFVNLDVVLEWGNHGRLGKKGDGIKASDNVDRMVYGIVEERVRQSVPNLRKYQFSGSWYQVFEFGNYRAMAIHGDEIKSFGGNIPAYGIQRKANQWASGVVEPFTDLYIGHYHQAMQLQLANGGSVYMTGSPESDNVYASEFVAATGRPSQRLNFVDLNKGQVTAEYRVWLD